MESEHSENGNKNNVEKRHGQTASENNVAENLQGNRLDGSRHNLTTDNPNVSSMPSSHSDSRLNLIKKYFMYIMIGGFVVSALISIFAVLLGEFNEVIAKALLTTLTIVVHSLLALGFMSVNHKKGPDEIVVNTLFGVTAVSVIGSILGIWNIISDQVVTDIYQAIFYAIIAAVIIRFLLYANRTDKITRMLANSTVGVTIFTFFLLMPSVFVNYPDTLPEFYQRILWATIILHVTLSVLVAIFNHIYVSQHPELKSANPAKPGTPTSVKVILFIIFLPVIISILSWIMSFFYRPYY